MAFKEGNGSETGRSGIGSSNNSNRFYRKKNNRQLLLVMYKTYIILYEKDVGAFTFNRLNIPYKLKENHPGNIFKQSIIVSIHTMQCTPLSFSKLFASFAIWKEDEKVLL